VSNDTLLFKRADPSQSFPLPPAPPFRFGGVFFLREVTTGALISFNCPDKLIDDTVEPLLIWVPSRSVLKLADASSGGMMLSDQAARSMV
jgi:hypothetical protein